MRYGGRADQFASHSSDARRPNRRTHRCVSRVIVMSTISQQTPMRHTHARTTRRDVSHGESQGVASVPEARRAVAHQSRCVRHLALGVRTHSFRSMFVVAYCSGLCIYSYWRQRGFFRFFPYSFEITAIWRIQQRCALGAQIEMAVAAGEYVTGASGGTPIDIALASCFVDLEIMRCRSVSFGFLSF
jgi:hypothetical protein